MLVQDAIERTAMFHKHLRHVALQLNAFEQVGRDLTLFVPFGAVCCEDTVAKQITSKALELLALQIPADDIS